MLNRRVVYAKVKEFFSGVFWPLTWLESRASSVGLLLSIFLLIAFSTLAGLTAVAYVLPSDFGSSPAEDFSLYDDTDDSSDGIDPDCNVLGVEIRGCILTYTPDDADDPFGFGDSCGTITSSEEVVWALDEASNNPRIKAVVLEIDSGGGSPVAADEIAAAVKDLGKPSIAWVRESAGSAAYWIASAADTIIASENSDIGSIGVTLSYVDNARQNTADGLTYNQLTTGKYKDIGAPDKPLTADERSLIQRDLDIILRNFIKAVAANRQLSVEKVTALADGSTMLGSMALQNGLIDQLGTKKVVWDQLQDDINGKPKVCWP